MKLRDYQEDIVSRTFEAWNSGHNRILQVQPTGTGKTVCFCHIAKVLSDQGFKVALLVHRKELLSQISVTLGKYEINHSILAPSNTIRSICKIQYDELKKCYYRPDSKLTVMSVNTVVRRNKDLSHYDYWIIDEGHHVLSSNMWGKAVNSFGNAKGLGVTATPQRTDKKGLGSRADGVFDLMIEGNNVEWHIEQGNLTEYRIYFPGKYIDMTGAKKGSDGDWTTKEIISRTEKAMIIGDIVSEYKKIADGKLGITFMPSVKLCEEVNQQFRASGIRSCVLTANTPDAERFDAVRAFRNKEIHQLINVDLFAEGFDLPAIEVVSMGRKTASLGWYMQAVGRVLRPCEGKQHGLIIDHVGNVMPEHGGHGLPDQHREWSLNRTSSTVSSKSQPSIIKPCPECCMVYSKTEMSCPYCGYEPKKRERVTPDMVDGDLTLLDNETIAEMKRNLLLTNSESPEELKNRMLRAGAPTVAAYSAAKNKKEEIKTRELLEKTVRKWVFDRVIENYKLSEIFKKFYTVTGTDTITCLSLTNKKMLIVLEKLLDNG